MKDYVVLWKQSERETILSWWEDISSNRSKRAELRRAIKPEDVLLMSGFHALYFNLIGTLLVKENNLLGLAAAAGILSHIDVNDPTTTFAQSCALPLEIKEGQPKVSELRFSQLQKSRTLNEFFIRMRRTIQLLRRNANVVSVADSVLLWYLEMINKRVYQDIRNKILVRWGLDYFQSLGNKNNS